MGQYNEAFGINNTKIQRGTLSEKIDKTNILGLGKNIGRTRLPGMS